MYTGSISRKIAEAVLVCVIVCGVMLISLPNAMAMQADGGDEVVPLPFTDVGTENWFYEQVRDVFEQGLMTGTGEGMFHPNMRVTRAMAVQVLYNRNDRPDMTGAHNPFADVAEDAWYHDAVIWAAANGVVQGQGDGTFAPGDYVTRAHLTVILDNYTDFARLELPPRRDSQPFADYMDIRNYAKEAIDRFFRAGVINGDPYDRFNPQGNATRAEFATMLSQFVRYSENLPGDGGGMPPAPPYGIAMPEYGFPDTPQPSPELPELPEPPPEPPMPQPPWDDDHSRPAYGFPSCCEFPPVPPYGVPEPPGGGDYSVAEYGFPCWIN